MRITGNYQKLGDVNYFIPDPLPPTNPTLSMNDEMISLYGEASFALGQLNEMCLRLPDPRRFIKAYVIKEAMLSSEIEGIHTTLMEIFTTTLEDQKRSKDTQLVLNYTRALDKALDMLQSDNLPLSTRVILKAHETLMLAGENSKADPGAFRKQSVKIGDLVPPPATEIDILISSLEKYINEPSEMLPLIKAGLVHVHFETIHPFLDGNGRIGRLLIVLMLINSNLLQLPILYPSYFFKKHHLEYYQTLDRVRTVGDFERWIVFFLKAIRDSAKDAYIRAKEIENLDIQIKELIQNHDAFSKVQKNALDVLELLFTYPMTNVVEISKNLGKSYNTVQNIFNLFVERKIVSENIIHKRNKQYRFELYLALLEKEYS